MFQSGAEDDIIVLPTAPLLAHRLRRISLNLFSTMGYALEAISDKGGDEDEEWGDSALYGFVRGDRSASS